MSKKEKMDGWRPYPYGVLRPSMYRAEVELRGRPLIAYVTLNSEDGARLEVYENIDGMTGYVLGVRRYCQESGEWRLVDFLLPPQGHYCVDPVEAAGEELASAIPAIISLREL